MDGCIYHKDQNKNEEYCFGLVEESESAILQCEVEKALYYSIDYLLKYSNFLA